jgi:hypothetical protein
MESGSTTGDTLRACVKSHALSAFHGPRDRQGYRMDDPDPPPLTSFTDAYIVSNAMQLGESLSATAGQYVI